jgi:anti-anti-sigma factor
MVPTPTEPIQFARLSDGIIVIRVVGKGTHLQSPALRHVFEQTRDSVPPPRYVIDLAECSSMDSTFMGTLASIGLFQRNRAGSSTILVNISEHVRHLLNTLGLKHILELRAHGEGSPLSPEEFTPATAPQINALDRIVMMIEAHEQLLDINSQNEVKFEGVLKSLRQSLEREKNRSQT